MRKQMIENAAYEVATQVRAVEDSIDTALTEVAELQARMMRASTVAAAGYGTIHPALQQLSTAVLRLVDTRGAIVACHAALAEAKGKVPGLRAVSWGDGQECPPASATVDLRIVA
jgi:DNA-binding FrmR family transcriptional regulator